MGDNLPSDIMINILSRLLTESLSVSSLICKTWRNLIYSDRSLAHTLSRRIYDQDSVDAVYSGKVSFVYLSYYSVIGHTLLKHMEYDDDDDEKHFKFAITNIIPAPDRKPCKIIGSCNGLICISVLSEKDNSIKDPIFICNPMTTEFVYLPKLTKKFSRGDYVVSGFGYHPCPNEYKVVRIYFRAASNEKPFVGRVQVYTLGSGKGWRTLESITYNLHPFASCGVLANGSLHWLDEDGKIVKFDLSDETFSVLLTPKDYDQSWDLHRRYAKYSREYIFRYFELSFLGGCLRITEHGNRHDNIWSFKKRDDLSRNKENNGKQDIEEEHYESSWSWAKDSFIWAGLDFQSSSVSTFAILKNNAKILFGYGCNRYRQDLRGYNPENISDDRIPNHSVQFVKSFVSLKSLGEEEAKIMESGEGTHELPSSDLDSEKE